MKEENPIKEGLIIIVIFVLLITFVSVSVHYILQAIDTPEWKKNRNRDRHYNPIKNNNDKNHYITEK